MVKETSEYAQQRAEAQLDIAANQTSKANAYGFDTEAGQNCLDHAANRVRNANSLLGFKGA